ncbi:MAG TPA: hypothetical protein VFS76_06135 [Pyrinomonadaceae bacterium]|nr:hypothetical protein [Pyrinomonadaceae bacterium]
MAALPPSDELLTGLQTALQETDPLRQLDSIEIVAVQAYLSRWGVKFPNGGAFPQTIKGWVEWAGHYSTDS